MTSDETKEKYPGVFTAYEFVLPSYGWMLARYEAADSRVQTLLVFAMTATFAMVGAAKALNERIPFSDWRFWLAALCFVLLTVIGSVARLRGGVVLANPRTLQEQWLHWDEWEFKKNAVYWAAEHFRQNANQIGTKSTAVAWMTGLLFAELVLLFAWLATASIL